MDSYFAKLAAFDLPVLGSTVSMVLALGWMAYLIFKVITAPVDDWKD